MDAFPTTEYYRHTKGRLDRAAIDEQWVLRTIRTPEHEEVQSDGRIRRWARIPEFGGRALVLSSFPTAQPCTMPFLTETSDHL